MTYGLCHFDFGGHTLGPSSVVGSLVVLLPWFNSGSTEVSLPLDKVSHGEVSPNPPKESGASRGPVRPFLDPCLYGTLLLML